MYRVSQKTRNPYRISKYPNSFKTLTAWFFWFLKRSKILSFDRVMGLWSGIRVAGFLGHPVWFMSFSFFKLYHVSTISRSIALGKLRNHSKHHNLSYYRSRLLWLNNSSVGLAFHASYIFNIWWFKYTFAKTKSHY